MDLPQDEGWCISLWHATSVPSPVAHTRTIHLPHLVTACFQFCTMLCVAVIQCRAARQQQAIFAEERPTKWVVLPAYAVAIWQFAIADFLRAVHTIANELGVEPRWFRILGAALVWTTWHTFTEGLALSLAQPSAGSLATRRCFIFAFLYASLSATTLSLLWWVGYREWALLVLYGLYVVFYGSMLPACIWRKQRPALRNYALFSFTIACLRLVGTILTLWFAQWRPPAVPASAYSCGALFEWTAEALQCIGKPLITYWTLIADSCYWMGLLEEETSHSLSRSVSQEQKDGWKRVGAVGNIRQPLPGLSLSPEIAYNVALAQDRLQAHPHVLYVPPAELSLHSNLARSRSKLGLSSQEKKRTTIRPIASGGFARVYRGTWRGRAVAVKLLTKLTLLPEDIRAFVCDAESLAQLSLSNSDHALEYCGVCIWPPALALILPLCEHGSLRHLLERSEAASECLDKGEELAERKEARAVYVPLWEGALHKEKYGKLDEATRWRLALQCCRAVAMLHALDPPLIHLDLKSANFFVAAATEEQLLRLKTRYVVKLGDLDCAVSEPDILRAAKAKGGVLPAGEWRLPQTVYWSAPEVIAQSSRKGSALLVGGTETPITTASDCYSLGMVLWEIGTSGFASNSVPFSSSSFAFDDSFLIEAICKQNRRPDIVPQMHTEYAQLIRDLWDADPSKRPTAAVAAQRLEALLSAHYSTSTLEPSLSQEDNSSNSNRSNSNSRESLESSRSFSPSSLSS